jgi:hypothetical protein
VRYAALRALAFDHPEPAVVGELAELATAGHDLERVSDALTLAARYGDDETRRRAVAELEGLLRRRLAAGERPDQSDLLFFAEHATASGVDLLEDLLDSRDPVVRGEALAGLARVKGDAMRARLETHLAAHDEVSHHAAAALGHLAAGSGDTELSARIEAAAAKSPYGRRLFAEALRELAGAAGTSAARRVAARLEPAERISFLAALEGRGIDEVGAVLAEVGLLTREEVAAGLAAQRQADEVGDGVFARTLDLLARAGRLAWFDVETDETPVRHDLLLGELAAVTGGALEIEAAHERWVGPAAEEGGDAKGGDGEDEEGRYQVEFIASDRLYRFTCEDFGDWYDLEAVLAAANRALADAGAAGRLVGLATGGQDAAYLFAAPEVAALAAGKGVFELERSADAGREAGRAFEDEVGRRLQGGDG